jgi:hypothetical protein
MSPSAVWQLLINRSEAVYVFCARFCVSARSGDLRPGHQIRPQHPRGHHGDGIKRPLRPACERHLVSFSTGNPREGFHRLVVHRLVGRVLNGGKKSIKLYLMDETELI